MIYNKPLFIKRLAYKGNLVVKKVSEYDQEIQQSHTADQPTAPRGRATEHL